MSTTTITVPITKEIEITQMYDISEINPCLRHREPPKLFEVFTGKKKKFQGIVTRCREDLIDTCTCYAYTDKDVIKKWNDNNPLIKE